MSLEVDASSRFLEYVRGRRVVVAGPARTLDGKRQGPLIDSFDLVVRFNEMVERIVDAPEVSADFGTRADIVYCNQVILRTHLLESVDRRRRFLDWCRRLRTKYLVCTNNSLSYDVDGRPSRACPAQDRQVLTSVAALLEDAGLDTRCRVLFTPSAILHQWLDGHWARTGFLAVFDLMMLDVARLYLTGMTFYHAGGHLLNDEHVELHPQKNRDGTWARSASGIGHDSSLECEIMRWLARFYRRTVGVDEDLLKILGYTTAPEHWPAESPTSNDSSTTEPS